MTPHDALQAALTAIYAEAATTTDPARLVWLQGAWACVATLLAAEGAARPQPASDTRPGAPAPAPRGEA